MIYDRPRDIQLQSSAHKNDTNTGKHKKSGVKRPHWLTAKAAVFFVMLYFGACVSFMIPLRPEYSDSEKRKLTEFPKFSLESLSSGEYFDGITAWFSDTFPFREQLTKMNTQLKGMSGISTVAIHGDVEAGDEIPDVPLDVPPADNTAPAVTAAPAVTEAPVTQKPTEPVEPAEPNPVTPEKSAIDKNITQTLGAVLIAGNSAYEYYNFSSSTAARFIDRINAIKGCSQNRSNVYTVIAPTSTDIVLDDAVRAEISSSSQQKALEYFNASFKGVTPVNNIYDTLRAHRNEYLYFRTDHHWTALGAYYAYGCFAQAKGIQPVPLESYETKSFDGFLGSFYSSSGQSPALSKTPDTVIAYEPFSNASLKFTQKDGQVISWPIVFDVTEYNSSGKYLTFIAGDEPYEIIENSDIPNGESCLVIKESYGNAFVPFLVPHYGKIHVIDPRHYSGTLSEFLAQNPVDDIIFVVNISTTRNTVFIDCMEDFIK